jgi:hypothetical protein
VVKLFGGALKKAVEKKVEKIFFVYFMFGECCGPSGEGCRGDGGGEAPWSENWEWCVGGMLERVVKVSGVGVTVEVWFHGVKGMV